jgi:hypothetical protein
VAIGKLINDFLGEGEAVPGGDGEGLDEDIGVAVEVRLAYMASVCPRAV